MNSFTYESKQKIISTKLSLSDNITWNKLAKRKSCICFYIGFRPVTRNMNNFVKQLNTTTRKQGSVAFIRMFILSTIKLYKVLVLCTA